MRFNSQGRAGLYPIREGWNLLPSGNKNGAEHRAILPATDVL
jgi:hypothetical protein